MDSQTRFGLRSRTTGFIRKDNIGIEDSGGDFTGHYRLLTAIAHIATLFEAKIDRRLEFKHPIWFDDTLIVTKENQNQHKQCGNVNTLRNYWLHSE